MSLIPLVVVVLAMAVLVLAVAVARRPAVPPAVEQQLASLTQLLERIERAVREELALARREAAVTAQSQREALETRLDTVRATVEARLTELQAGNEKKLDEMRHTVDEKLQGTLEQRLGESFKQVSERLEQVHRGLGEMQQLATGVGDLKKVLANVKVRGTWGEVQLENLLAQVLTREQFETNVAVRPRSQERVEFAIKLPGKGDGDEPVLLPIDSKFPVEDYQRLVDASEAGDADAVSAALKQLEATILSCARDIRDKYIVPPRTTDFAIMFLPTEGLYAEVIRRTSLVDSVQQSCRVVIVGPTTLAALLNSLQMGFRTVAIEKRSSEVWKLLGAVKAEFGRFGTTLAGVKKRLAQAQDEIESAEARSRRMENRLKKVEELPEADAKALLGDAATVDVEALEAEDTGAAV